MSHTAIELCLPDRPSPALAGGSPPEFLVSVRLETN